MYTRKCHKETPRVAILNKEKSHFFSFTKSENRRAKQALPGVSISVGGRGSGERVWEGEYGTNTAYTCMLKL
jgi:hypothetical protein